MMEKAAVTQREDAEKVQWVNEKALAHLITNKHIQL